MPLEYVDFLSLPSVHRPSTLNALLQWRSTYQKDKQAFIFLHDGVREEIMTFQGLHQKACTIAASLQKYHAEGKTALLLYQPGLEYITAFFGCLYAGVIAVPAYPPQMNKHAQRIQAIIADSQASLILTTTKLFSTFQRRSELLSDTQSLSWLTTDTLAPFEEGSWQSPDITGNTVAFLQYTSGSTGNPKGVMVTHANLLYNSDLIFRHCGNTQYSRSVSWLPPYHDMGLIGGILQSIYGGFTATLMSPFVFLQHPIRWLQAISRTRATFSGGPDSAYELCVRRVTKEDLATLDLSSWEVAFNGAEPVHRDTLEHFTRVFAPCGFQPVTFYPCYGLAEATLMAAGGHKRELPVIHSFNAQELERHHRAVLSVETNTQRRELVGCGQPLTGQQIVIVHPETCTPCPDNTIGELWLTGPSKASGYWRRPEETLFTFHAKITGDDNTTFLRTGDLGFFYNGELFVTGRLKDLIIIDGTNHYPQDIEATVAGCHPALRSHACAAFSIDVRNQERLVVVQEVERTHRTTDLTDVFNKIRQAIAEEHAIQVFSIALIKPGTLPKTSSGKIQRAVTRQAFLAKELTIIDEWSMGHQENAAEDSQHAFSPDQQLFSSKVPTTSIIESWLVEEVARIAGFSPQDIHIRRPFSYYGLGSKDAVTLAGKLATWLGCSIPPTLAYDYPSIEAVTEYITHRFALSPSQQRDLPPVREEPIAIIGLGCRFPQAKNPGEFWQMLCNGVDAVTEIPRDRWDINDYYASDPTIPGKTTSRWGSFLDQIDQFDPYFFGISPREAINMDPQHRLLLEVSWEALEDAGLPLARVKGSQTGVFIGATQNEYNWLLFSNIAHIDSFSATGSAHGITANRLSYVFDLHGPSLTVDTICSSSLLAVHLACQSLAKGECTMAIAGGANLILTPGTNIALSKLGVLSPDGRCRAFDAQANGMVRGEGVGVVILKPLSSALADKDPIYAVIRGSAVTQDGRSNGIAAPSRQAQEAVLRAAYAVANVLPHQVQYVETHGTGTIIGDPIEAQAIGNVLTRERPAGPLCYIGSVKTNLGHLEAAGGIASLIKVALALKHHTLPPSIHFQSPNPYIPFEQLRLAVPQKVIPWPTTSQDERAYAGVTSLSFGGTNVHVVLEDAPPSLANTVNERQEEIHQRTMQILPISAHHPEALMQLVRAYRLVLAKNEHSLDAICAIASTRRTHHEFRQAFSAASREEILEQIEAYLQTEAQIETITGTPGNSGRHNKLVFVFSGHGSQWLGMGATLLEKEPIFREMLEQCNLLLQKLAGWSLLQVLTEGTAHPHFNAIDVIQPTIFAIQIALAELWKAWGIIPDAVIGHSMGEVAAAYVAGALDLEQAISLIYQRSRLLKQVSARGSMMAVELSTEQAEHLLSDYSQFVWIAASNSPTSTILSGDTAQLAQLAERLALQGIFTRMVDVDVAAHSPHMEPLSKELQLLLSDLVPKDTSLPLYSTVTGQLCIDMPLNASYWARNLREPVLFSQALQHLLADGYQTLLEISPHPILLPAIRQGLQHSTRANVTLLASLQRNEDAHMVMFQSLATLYQQDHDIQWHIIYPASQQPVPLPMYPWQHERFWLEADTSCSIPRMSGQTEEASGHPLMRQCLYMNTDTPVETHYWELKLSVDDLPYLKDHQVQGTILLPAAVMIEITQMVAQTAFGSEFHSLMDMQFQRALILPNTGSQTIQIRITFEDTQRASFSFHSRPSHSAKPQVAWIRHAVGNFSLEKEPLAATIKRAALEKLRSTFEEEMSAYEHYELLHKRGMLWGPAFQGIARIWRKKGEALAQLQIPETLSSDVPMYMMHPVLLDSALQVANAAFFGNDALSSSPDPYLMTRLTKFRMYKTAAGRLWSHGIFSSQLSFDKDAFEGCVFIYDDAGDMIAEAQGVYLQRLNGAAATHSHPGIQNLFYELQWQKKDHSGSSSMLLSQNNHTGIWVIFIDNAGIGHEIAALLKAQQKTCIIVSQGARYQQLDTTHYIVNPGSSADMQRLADIVRQEYDAQCQGILYLWSLTSQNTIDLTFHDLQQACAISCETVLYLTQAFASMNWQTFPSLWLVSPHTVRIDDTSTPIIFQYAALWGLGRTIALEHKELWGGIIDLDIEGITARDISALCHEILSPEGEMQLAFRQGQRYVARLSEQKQDSSSASSFSLRADGYYLITGGLGTLGLYTARFLLQQGARFLILLNRSILPPRSIWDTIEPDDPMAQKIAAIREMEAAGAQIQISSVDVANEQELRSYLSAFRQHNHHPIRGVIHAAGVMEECFLSELDAQTFYRVLQPKVYGSWLLHHLLLDEPLEFFVLFSSIASLIATPGEAPYAAANAFLDAFSQYRVAQGLPTTCINWGLWDVENSLASTRNEQAQMIGAVAMSAEACSNALKSLMAQGINQAIVAQIDWPKLLRYYGQDRKIHSLLERLHEPAVPGGVSPTPVDLTLSIILTMDDTKQRVQQIETFLQKQVARTLGYDAKRVDLHRPLSALGIDSLVSVELRNVVETQLGVTLPLMLFLQGSSIVEVAQQITERLNTVMESPQPDLVTISNHEARRGQLSYGQQSLWFLHRLAKTSSPYNIDVTMRIVTEVDISSLRRSFETIVKRHSILRSIFPSFDGEAVQMIQDDLPEFYQEKDATEWSESTLHSILLEEVHRAFDLDHGPLIRINLYKMRSGEHILQLVVHHIIGDLWSLGIIMDELGCLYQAEQAGVACQLPELPVNYLDFVDWQRKNMAGTTGKALWTYWHKQLESSHTVLELPLDHPRPPIQTYQNTYQTIKINKQLSNQIKALSEQYEVTLYVVLLTTFFILLHRYTQQDNILVGTPTTGRSRAEWENVVGYFVNMMTIRADFTPGISFETFLRQIQANVLAGLQHQDYPFSLLVDRMQPTRDPGRPPLVQVAFAWQKSHLPHLQDIVRLALGEERAQFQLGDLNFEGLSLGHGIASFELLFMMTDTADSIEGTLHYNTDLFEETTIRRMLGHFQMLLEGIVTSPGRRISAIPLLTASEQQQLLLEQNVTAMHYRLDLCLHNFIEDQVERTPDAVAVTFEGTHLTYLELNRRANQLAHFLQTFNAGPEELVGLCMERSLELVVGLLGILKTGAAYVPFDPTYPQERLAFMLADTHVPVLLTEKRWVARLPEQATTIICLDADWQHIGRESTEQPASSVLPANRAYVIYTSGSTGRPKGVMNTHQGICNRLLWMQNAYGLEETDVVLQKTPFSFDVSVWEFFWPLLTGARLVLARPDGHRDSAYLVELIAEQAITTLHFVPSMLRVFLEERELEQCKGLKRVMCSGEALLFEYQERFFERLNSALYNLYGPTEAAVDVSHWACKPESSKWVVPIGYPIANIQLYVLDQYLNPVPVGVPGELHIGGIGLARGYLNRPDLTAERFIANPFAGYPSSGLGEDSLKAVQQNMFQPGSRLYKTGDRVCYLPDGSIKFLGRIDYQVKLHGFRIELGEIEASLGQHPSIRECAVIAREDQPGNKRLLAYIVLAQGASPTSDELRHFLLEKLPDYMVPATFISLEKLPLTTNGKVNRSALPAPAQDRPELEEAYVSPQTPGEEILAGIWASTLGVEQVGIHDNFFALGGDSILSLQIIARAARQGLHFTVQDLFQHQTIAQLAAVTQYDTAFPLNSSVPNQAFQLISSQDRQQMREEIEDAYPLSQLQIGMVYHSDFEHHSVVYHDIFPYAIHLPFEISAMRNVLAAITAQHRILRTAFDFSSYSEPLQLIYRNVPFTLGVSDLQDASEDEQHKAIKRWQQMEQARPINWQQPPLIRFHIFHRSLDNFQLVLSFHHAILDGWSVSVLCSQIFHTYQTLLTTGTFAVEPFERDVFQDFIAQEQKSLRSRADAEYWRQKLLERPASKLPREHVVQQGSQRIMHLLTPFARSLTLSLKQVALLGIPLKSILLAAHAKVISILTMNEDIVAGLVSNGRPESSNSEQALGLFLNTLPLRLQLRGGTWLSLLEGVFAAEREMLPFRWYPLSAIKKEQKEQSLFDAVFNYVHFHTYQAALASKKLQILAEEAIEETNFVFVANFFVDPATEDISMRLDYQSDQFSQTQIQRISEYYVRVLSEIAYSSAERHEHRTLLSQQELDDIVLQCHITCTSYPREACLQQLFEGQVTATPDAIALLFEDEQLTYAELNQRANQVAGYLLGLGVRSELPVGLAIERSLMAIVGMVAIIKAGGIYVPIDPTYPQARQALLLADAQVAILLTEQSLLATFSSFTGPILCLDTDWSTIAQQAQTNLERYVPAKQLAYIMYTSGSTGQPKGICIPHQAIIRLVQQTNYITLQQHDCIAQASTISFDAATFEIWGALLHGARLVGLPRETILSPTQMMQALLQYGINTLFLTTALFNQIIRERPDAFHMLDYLLTGGEAINPHNIRQALTNGSPKHLLHVYGPTESTTFASWFEIANVDKAASTIPIGQAIANTQLYVLDKYANPVPSGAPGELYIGGDGLARGYLHHPDLTAERFIPHPWSEEPGQRLYKTGDLVRSLPDGTIEFLGRLDTQVKLRGFRIELAEIEIALLALEAVQECTVLLQEEPSGEKRLVAYILPKQGQKIDSYELRSQLQQQLPEYMLPSVWTTVEEIPLTANGKVDRAKLPTPEWTTTSTARPYVAPRNAYEESLAAIWATVLAVKQVGIHDSFFDIGGHSLLAIQLISHIRATFQMEIPLRTLFDAPTVAAMASTLMQKELELADQETLAQLLSELE